MRRQLTSATFIVIALAVLAGCGPMITDRARLPDQVTVCGWNWGYDSAIEPRTLSEIANEIGGMPPVLDLQSLLCPRGACTDADVRAGNLGRDECRSRVWVRVGWDAYAQYGMLFRL